AVWPGPSFFQLIWGSVEMIRTEPRSLSRLPSIRTHAVTELAERLGPAEAAADETKRDAKSAAVTPPRMLLVLMRPPLPEGSCSRFEVSGCNAERSEEVRTARAIQDASRTRDARPVEVVAN